MLVEEGMVRSFSEFRQIEADGEPLHSLKDCCDMHEVLLRKAENRRLAHEAMTAEQ